MTIATRARDVAFALYWETRRLHAENLTPTLIARESFLAGIAFEQSQQHRRLEDHIVIEAPRAEDIGYLEAIDG